MTIIPLIIILILISILFIKSKNNEEYKLEIEDISKDEYPLKDFIVIGLYVLDLVGTKFVKKINSSIWDKLIILYGIDVEKQSRVYYANKFTLSLISSFMVYLFYFLNGKFSLIWIITGIVFPIILFYLSDYMLDESIKKRAENIKYDFPEFLSKLSLLINAGLTLEAAWDKILSNAKEKSILNRELKITLNDIKANIPREVALRNLSRRCKVSTVTKFTNIVIQNMNKGTSDMSMMLDALGNECWIERQAFAKQKGEQASTKLLFPMMLMLVAVFIITIIPAVLQMFGF